MVDETNKSMSWVERGDRLVNLFKWPAAIVSVAITPLLAWGMWLLLWRVLRAPLNLVPFAVGGLLFVYIWRRWLGRGRLGRFAITLEHESTHALFAMLTGHQIVGFRATMGKGGQVQFLGRGNWLIMIAPYFFPTSALLMFLVAYLLPFQGFPWRSFLLGVALAYHVVSTYRETHRDQTDIQQLGTTFCWMFLPAANLAVVGLLISYAHGGSAGLSHWWNDLSLPAQQVWHTIAEWISDYRTSGSA